MIVRILPIGALLLTAAGCRSAPARADAAADTGAGAAADTVPAADAAPDAGADADAAAGVAIAGRLAGDPWRMSLVDVQDRGVMIDQIDMRSFAAPLLRPGDIIIGVDDRSVVSSADVERYLLSVSPGAVVVVAVRREDGPRYIMLQVPEEPPAASR